jgi:hypothetical protein
MCAAVETFATDLLDVNQSSAKNALITYLTTQIKTIEDFAAEKTGAKIEKKSFLEVLNDDFLYLYHFHPIFGKISTKYIPSAKNLPEVVEFINSQQGMPAKIKIFWSLIEDQRFPLLTTGRSFTFEVTKAQ